MHRLRLALTLRQRRGWRICASYRALEAWRWPSCEPGWRPRGPLSNDGNLRRYQWAGGWRA